MTSTSLVEIEQSVAEEVKILYRDQPITDLSLFQVKVENSGNQTILEEDYARPIRFVFPSEAEIVEAMVLESSPRNIGMTVRKEQNTATLSSVLLNEEDRIIVRILVSNMPAGSDAQPFYVDARIAGVKETPIVNAIEDRETTKGVSANFDYLSGFLSGFVGAGIYGLRAAETSGGASENGGLQTPTDPGSKIALCVLDGSFGRDLVGLCLADDPGVPTSMKESTSVFCLQGQRRRANGEAVAAIVGFPLSKRSQSGPPDRKPGPVW